MLLLLLLLLLPSFFFVAISWWIGRHLHFKEGSVCDWLLIVCCYLDTDVRVRWSCGNTINAELEMLEVGRVS